MPSLRLLDIGIETDAWTVNPGRDVNDAILHTLVEAKVRQITTDVPGEIVRLIRSFFGNFGESSLV